MEEHEDELFNRFDEIAAEVWNDLKTIIPAEFRSHIDLIQFFIEDEPGADLLSDLPEDLAADPESLCGLHVGTPITLASITSPDPQPTRVFLFRYALVDLIDPDLPMSEQEEGLREEIAITLLHEIGHYFGLEEDDLTRLGYD